MHAGKGAGNFEDYWKSFGFCGSPFSKGSLAKGGDLLGRRKGLEGMGERRPKGRPLVVCPKQKIFFGLGDAKGEKSS